MDDTHLLAPVASSTSPVKRLNGQADASLSLPASRPAHTRPPIPALTGLRAALMLHVLVRNMQYYGPPDTLGWMVSAGAVGVSTFFCLSGFILAYCYGDHRHNTWRCYFAFISRRYARLLPIYWLSLLLCVGQQVNAVREFGWNAWTVLHWLAYATGTHEWFPWPRYTLRNTPWLNPTLWALSCVLCFYVTFPLLMRAMRWFLGVDRLSDLPNSRSTSRLLVLFVLCAAAVYLPLAIPSSQAGPYWYTPYFRIGEFGFGLLAAALYISIRNTQQQQHKQVDMESAAGAQQRGGSSLIERLASTSLLHSPLVLDAVVALAVLLVIMLGLPSVSRPDFLELGSWLSLVLCYIILVLALSSPAKGEDSTGQRRHSVFGWLLTRPLMLELGAMSFCFYAFHYVPLVYAQSIGLPPNRSAAVEFCAAVGMAWLGYKYVETPVYNALAARLPVCRCHKE